MTDFANWAWNEQHKEIPEDADTCEKCGGYDFKKLENEDLCETFIVCKNCGEEL